MTGTPMASSRKVVCTSCRRKICGMASGGTRHGDSQAAHARGKLSSYRGAAQERASAAITKLAYIAQTNSRADSQLPPPNCRREFSSTIQLQSFNRAPLVDWQEAAWRPRVPSAVDQNRYRAVGQDLRRLAADDEGGYAAPAM